MAVSGIQIRRMLQEFGWELIEARTIAKLWVGEIWLIRSSWSPTSCDVYLTFEIDGQADQSDISQTWAVTASVSRPDDWLAEEGDDVQPGYSTGRISIAKEKHLDRLFDELANLRNRVASAVN